MASTRNKISPKSDCFKKPGRHSDGGGLYLAIDGDGETQRRRWLYLFQWNGKRREMGLGGYPAVSLAAARKARDDAEQLVRRGVDPIAARAEAKKAGEKEKPKPTFGEMADDYMRSKQNQWRNDKHRAQWAMTLTKYAAPIRSTPVDQIDTAAVLSVLTPLWQKTPETASRLRGRIEVVLDAARAFGHIPSHEANPARWRGHLDKLLPKQPKLARGHHAAMPYEELRGFIAKLRERDALAAIALELCVLTATRTSEVLKARWDEIDMEAKVWKLPPLRMKGGRVHRIPLSYRAIEIFEKLSEVRTSEYVFPGQRAGRPLSNMAMLMVLRRMGLNRAGASSVTVHGFRSSFRDWAGNETHFQREVAQAALAHVVGDKAEQAYRRSDALEKRRALMEAWAQYCEPSAETNVLKFLKPG